MKKQIFLIIAVLLIIPGIIKAQTNSKYAEDEKAIRQVMENIEAAWAAGDGKKFATYFTDDVDYMVWNGMYNSGREANEKGHQQIFDTFYKGTELKNKFRKIRFLSENIVAVHLESGIYKNGKKLEDVPDAVPLLIFQKTDGKWKVVIFQNTPIIKRGELVVGRMDEEKKQ